jgi:hypothetical protein
VELSLRLLFPLSSYNLQKFVECPGMPKKIAYLEHFVSAVERFPKHQVAGSLMMFRFRKSNGPVKLAGPIPLKESFGNLHRHRIR